MLKNRKKKEKEIKKSSFTDRFKPVKVEPPDMSYLHKALEKYSNKFWFHTHENNECLKCSEVDKLMIRIGAFCFCTKCFENEFDSKAEFRDQDTYQKWYKVWEQKLNLWFEFQDKYKTKKENKKERKIKRKIKRRKSN